MGVRSSISPGGLAKLVGRSMTELKKQPAGTRWEIGILIGRASGLKPKTDNKTGEVKNALVGYFQALTTDGKVLAEAGECYLPQAMHKMVEGPLHEAGAASIDFAIKLDAIEDDTAITGYRYDCIPIGEPAKADPLAKLRAEAVGSAAPQIADQSGQAETTEKTKAKK